VEDFYEEGQAEHQAMQSWFCREWLELLHSEFVAIAKELYTMGKMIGEDHGARLAKATPARLTNDDWVPHGK
jgi:hypothetical protein